MAFDKDPLHLILGVPGRQGNLPRDFLIRTKGELHVLVHGTKGTCIVGTAPGHPQDEAVGFTGGPEHRCLIIIEIQSEHRRFLPHAVNSLHYIYESVDSFFIRFFKFLHLYKNPPATIIIINYFTLSCMFFCKLFGKKNFPRFLPPSSKRVFSAPCFL